LSPWIKNGRSKNGKQFVTANESLFFTLYFIIYDGIGFKIAAELNPNTALHELSALLADKLKDEICLSWATYTE